MTSQRHSTCGRPPRNTGDSSGGTAAPGLVRPASNRVDDTALLSAARECVLENGVRRSTLTEIARRAGVSRMTLYRRFPDVSSMVTALMTSEFSDVLRRARAAEGTGTARRRLITALINGVRLLQEAPLLRRVLETDSELLLPYLVDRFGSTQLTAENFLRGYLVAGHADGSVRRSDPGTQARVLLVMAQSFVLSVKPATTGTDTRTLSAELATQLDAALRPAEAAPHHDRHTPLEVP